MKDFDGNSYEAVVLSNKLWLDQNLKVSKFANGDPISEFYISSNPENGYYYPRSVTEDSRKICPVGWHVSSWSEWQGGNMDVLKSTTTWNSGTISSTNSSGFNVYSSGYRDTSGIFKRTGLEAYFWTTTRTSDINPTTNYPGWILALIDTSNGGVKSTHTLDYSSIYNPGFLGTAGIRCVRDAKWLPDSINVMYGGKSLYKASVTQFDSLYFSNSHVFLLNSITAKTDSITNVGAITADVHVSFGDTTGANVDSTGICWSTSPNPTTLDNKVLFVLNNLSVSRKLYGLNENTTYYVRAFATNAKGHYYGTELSFSTNSSGSAGQVTDIEGNIYSSIKFDDHIWMGQNLAVTKYNDGTTLSTNISNTDGAYKIATYGKAYTKYVVQDQHNVCPSGWHVPAQQEWDTLFIRLGGANTAALKLKSTSGWDLRLGGHPGTNESGMNIHPTFSVGFGARLWTIYYATNASNNYGQFNKYADLDTYRDYVTFVYSSSTSDAYTIRCLKD